MSSTESKKSSETTVKEISEQELDKVVGGTTNLMDACSKGKHVPTVTIAV